MTLDIRRDCPVSGRAARAATMRNRVNLLLLSDMSRVYPVPICRTKIAFFFGGANVGVQNVAIGPHCIRGRHIAIKVFLTLLSPYFHLNVYLLWCFASVTQVWCPHKVLRTRDFPKFPCCNLPREMTQSVVGRKWSRSGTKQWLSPKYLNHRR